MRDTHRSAATQNLHSHDRILRNNMANRSETVLEKSVNSFTEADELMDFAVIWGIQDSPAVQLRLFRPKNPGE